MRIQKNKHFIIVTNVMSKTRSIRKVQENFVTYPAALGLNVTSAK